MTLPASALPVEAPPAFLGVAHSLTGKLWRDRLDARGAARALAITQRYQLPEMLARVLAGRDVDIDAVEDFLDPTIRKLMPDPFTVTQMEAAARRIADAAQRGEKSATVLTSSVPSNSAVPSNFAFGPRVRPISVIAVTDLPEPDSPTIETISPGSTENETPSTACTIPSSVAKETFSPDTSSSGDAPLVVMPRA